MTTLSSMFGSLSCLYSDLLQKLFDQTQQDLHFRTLIDFMTPLTSASIWFIIFIASIMQSVSPSLTVSPTFTWEVHLEMDTHRKVPTIGDRTSKPLSSFCDGLVLFRLILII